VSDGDEMAGKVKLKVNKKKKQKITLLLEGMSSFM
jgi:hypothetical protein